MKTYNEFISESLGQPLLSTKELSAIKKAYSKIKNINAEITDYEYYANASKSSTGSARKEARTSAEKLAKKLRSLAKDDGHLS